MSKPSTKIFLTLFALLCCLPALLAQPKFNSPYSRIGIGDAFDQNFAAASGMGGLGSVFFSKHTANVINPASYAYLRTTSFDIGLYGQYSSLDDANNESQEIWSGNLSYLSLAFPIKNPLNQALDREQSPFSWGMGFSLLPLSNVGYLIELTEEVPGTGTANYSFEGSGGLYRLLWSNGFKYKEYSFGLNLGYLFGNLDNRTTIAFPDLESSFVNLLRDEISVTGFVWDAGFMYDYRFKRKGSDGEMENTGKYVVVGAYGRSPNSFSTRSQSLRARNNPFFSLRGTDTLSFTDTIRGDGRLPAQFGLGVMTGKENKWMAGIQIESTPWSQYENEVQVSDAKLRNSWRLSIGGQITPDHISYNSYGKRMSYRLGAFYGTDPRIDTNGEQLKRYGATAGFGFPLYLPNRKLSYLDVSMEVGQFGTDDSLKEFYARMTVGFSLNDNSWFIKRKFY
ncbi:MAG: hypothetical protein AAFV95_27550 [Bacteroidota bacterium]